MTACCRKNLLLLLLFTDSTLLEPHNQQQRFLFPEFLEKPGAGYINSYGFTVKPHNFASLPANAKDLLSICGKRMLRSRSTGCSDGSLLV